MEDKLLFKNGTKYGKWASCVECGKKKSRCKIGKCKECRKLVPISWNKGLKGEEYLKHFNNKPIPPIKFGSENNFWKGGITKLTDQIRTCSKYKNWRTNIYKRDNYKCTNINCTTNSNKLNADHIIPFSELLFKFKINSLEEALNCDNLWFLENGRTLC
jgi:hypothetical protein